MGPVLVVVVLAVILTVVTVGLVLHLHVVRASETDVVVLSGRARVDPETGELVGYRFLVPGSPERFVRIPLIEALDRMDATPFRVEVEAPGATFAGGGRHDVRGVATVRLAREPGVTRRAIEVFLGQPREEIVAVVTAALEGALQGACSKLRPDQEAAVQDIFAASGGSALAVLGLELISCEVRIGA